MQYIESTNSNKQTKGAKTMNPANMQSFTMEQIEEGIEAMVGFCVSCGAERECCEPDAREYECEECGQNSVYGAEELVVMGLVM